MKPSEKAGRHVIWRFKDTGITIQFDRNGGFWGGTINTENGSRSLPLIVLDFLVAQHNLERFI